MRRRSIEDLLIIAHCGLRTNPTITVYTFEGGVEHRRPANPWAGLNESMRKLGVAAARAAESMRDMFAASTIPRDTNE